MRMVEPGVTEGIVEYVTIAVLALHRNLVDYLGHKTQERWSPIQPVPAASRRVGILGVGQLGERVLLAARGMGASRLRIFWSVFLPITAPGIIGAGLIVFVFALGFMVTPAILGGGRSIMATELVWLRMFQSPDWGLGAPFASRWS